MPKFIIHDMPPQLYAAIIDRAVDENKHPEEVIVEVLEAALLEEDE